MQPTGNPYSLYFHIPFCHRKCDYCHFFVVPDQERFHDPFLTALKQEWDLRQPLRPPHRPESIYFGGGTPSRLSPKEIGTILSWIGDLSECEVTLEANPDQLTREQLMGYREVGINRLSIGVQSLDDTLLAHLSRTHSAKCAMDMVEMAAECGFDHLSIDLMYDIPHQTERQWEETLHLACSLPIQHLSFYNLTIEPHTPFYKRGSTLALPDADQSLRMLEMGIDCLESYGFARYEISAFGRPSKHNLGYWTDRPFLGFGPSAFSDWEGRRFRTIANFWRYIKLLEARKEPIDFEETLSPQERERERVAVGLRVLTGVLTPLDLSPLIQEGWIEMREGRYCLTQRGLLFYDTVAAEIIAL